MTLSSPSLDFNPSDDPGVTRREQLLSEMTLRIRQSLNLTAVLESTTEEIYQFLKVERVIIYELQTDGSGVVVAESVQKGWDSLLGRRILDHCFARDWVEPYLKGRVQAIEDIYHSSLAPCHVQLLAELQVKANLVVPIINQPYGQGEEAKLWGLLVAQQCARVRHWQSAELELLKHLANHVAIAIQQSQLHAQLKAQLEHQKQVEAQLKRREQAQTLLAEFGQYAIAHSSLEQVIERGIEIVTEFLAVEYCGVLELLSNQAAFMLRAGRGWQPEWVGKARINADHKSQAGYTLLRKTPVIVEDLRLETRFSGTPFLHNEKIISGISLTIQGQDHPFGVLTLHTRQPRHFTRDDVTFIQGIANIIGAEADRYEVKEELDYFFNLSLDLFSIAGFDGYFKRINPSFCKTLGYEEATLLSQPFITWVHPDDQESTLNAMQRLSQNLPVINFENRYRKADGSYCWLSWNAYSYEDELIYAVARDITKTKETKEQLRQSEQNFRQIAENIREVFFIQESNNQAFTYVSPAFEEIWGWKTRDLYENPALWMTTIVTEDYSRIQAQFEQVFWGQQLNAEYRIRRPDGEQRWIWCRTFAVKNAEGDIYRIVGIAEDITQRKQAEAELQALNEALENRVKERTQEVQFVSSRLMALMENLQMGVLVKDENEQVILANQALCHLLCSNAEENSCCLVREKQLAFPEDYQQSFAEPELFHQRYQEIIRRRQGVMDEEFMLTDGRILEQSYVPIWIKEEYAGHLWLYRDVTKPKQVETALRKSERKFRTFVQTAGTIIIVLSDDYRILEWNTAAEQISGYEREEVMGENFLLLFLIPQDRKLTKTMIQNAISKQEKPEDRATPAIRQYESLLLKKDGSQALIRWHLNPLEDQDSQGGIIACGQEITVTEQALRESEERFRSIFDQAAVGIVQISAGGQFILMNDKFLQLVGYSSESLKNRNFHDIIHPDDVSETLTYLSQLLTQSQGNISLETRLIRADETVLWINLAMSLVWESPQLPKYFIGIIQDISDRFTAAEALWDSEERFRAIFEQVAVGMSICTLDGKFFRVNQKLCDIVGYSHIELLSRTFYEITLEEYRPRFQNAVTQLLQGERNNCSLEKCYLCQDGAVRWVNVLLSLMRDHTRQPKYFIYVVEDISDRKQAEQLQGELMRRNSSIVEALGEIVYEYNVLDQSIHWQGHYQKVLGYVPEEMGAERSSWLNRVCPEDLPAIEQEFARAFRENKIYDLEYRFRHHNGNYLWVYDRGVMHGEINGQPQQVIGVLRDVTERKRAEEKLKVNLTEKEVLLKEIHHRVKNNLYVISSLLNIQSTYVEDPTVVEFFQDSQNRIQTMAMIHEQLYQSDDLAQIDFKNYLHRLVNNLLSSYNPDPDRIKAILEVQSVPLALETAIPCGLLINELVTNAFKHAFLPNKPGELNIILTQDVEQTLHLIVADNGKGMSPQIDLEEVTSLGLRLVRILTEQLDGEIELQTSSAGTTFHLMIFPED